MGRLLEQLPTLLGVILGAVATYGTTALTERRKWRREQSIRWDERRVGAYMEYASAVKKVISIASRLAVQDGQQVEHHFMAPEYRLADLEAAEQARTVCWEAMHYEWQVDQRHAPDSVRAAPRSA